MAALPMHDQECLRDKAYADDSRLDVRRRTHQLYTVEHVDFGRWTLDLLQWRGDERVLDVGCGPGDLLRGMASSGDGWGMLVGFDYSPGMIAQAIAQAIARAAASARNTPIYFFTADAQAVPLPSERFDVVMARHMLYHVPDIDRAVAEAARLLRPGGRFLAVTNAASTMPEYKDLIERAGLRFPHVTHVERGTERFALEDGAAFLDPYFDHVQTHTLRGTLRFPTAQPFVDYVASSRALIMRPAHSDAEWQAVLDFVEAEIQTVIARQGRFDVTKLTGAIVGVKES